MTRVWESQSDWEYHINLIRLAKRQIRQNKEALKKNYLAKDEANHLIETNRCLEKALAEESAIIKREVEVFHFAGFPIILMKSHRGSRDDKKKLFGDKLEDSFGWVYGSLPLGLPQIEEEVQAFEKAYAILEDIIQKEHISKEDPEEAILLALAEAKKQGNKIVLKYYKVKELADHLKKKYKEVKEKAK